MELNTKNLFDFKHLINCTLDGKIAWKTLKFLLNDLTPTLPKAKELLKIILQEFETFHRKSKDNKSIKEPKQNEDESESEDEAFDENSLDHDEDDNKFEILQEDVENEYSDETLKENYLANENDGVNNYGCQPCNEKFYDSVKLKEHIDEKHNKEKNFAYEEEQPYDDEIEEINDISDAEDFRKNEDIFSKAEHKIEVTHKENDEPSEKTFKCTICTKQFQLKPSVRRHFRKVHTEDYQRSKEKVDLPFKCKLCERQFKLKTSLNFHKKRVHVDTKAVCDVCGEKFYDLQKHMLVHTRQTPYECKVCSKRFNKLERLKFHEGVHTFNKVKCRFCGKELRSQAALAQHERTHTGEKPLSCEHCEKRFNSPYTMKIHNKNHHSKL